MKRVLILATTPFMHDGLTKIIMDVYDYSKERVSFEFASSFYEENEYWSRLKLEHAPVHVLPRKRKVLEYMRGIYKIVRKGGYNGVYIHGNSAMMFLEAFPARLAGVKSIITHCHNTKSDFPLVHYIVKPFFNKIVTDKIACSELAGAWAYSGDYKVVLNGIDIAKYRFDQQAREEYRRKLGWEKNFIIGHVGRFNKQKNHSFLIDIFREIYRKDTTARLLLIGEGELMEAVVQRVKALGLSDAVRFLGITDCVDKYMQAMDLFLLPSLFEGLCIVGIEAQASGLPLVITDTTSKQIQVTDQGHWMSLNSPPLSGGQKALSLKGCVRQDTSRALAEAGFDKSATLEIICKILCNTA